MNKLTSLKIKLKKDKNKKLNYKEIEKSILNILFEKRNYKRQIPWEMDNVLESKVLREINKNYINYNFFDNYTSCVHSENEPLLDNSKIFHQVDIQDCLDMMKEKGIILKRKSAVNDKDYGFYLNIRGLKYYKYKYYRLWINFIKKEYVNRIMSFIAIIISIIALIF